MALPCEKYEVPAYDLHQHVESRGGKGQMEKTPSREAKDRCGLMTHPTYAILL
jgi:hypothetical protein